MNCTNKIIVSSQSCLSVGKDPDRFVVHVFMHNHRGAVGTLLNGRVVSKLSHVFLKPVFNSPEGRFGVFKQKMLDKMLDSIPLHYGGPSKTDGIYFLHGYDRYADVTGVDDQPEQQHPSLSENRLIDGVYFGTPFTFGHIVEANLLETGRFRFLTGQFKWYATQLETEIDSGHWQVVDPESDLFFDIVKCEGLLPMREKANLTINPSMN